MVRAGQTPPNSKDGERVKEAFKVIGIPSDKAGAQSPVPEDVFECELPFVGAKDWLMN